MKNPGTRVPTGRAGCIQRLAADADLHEISRQWLIRTAAHRYTYLFDWLGRPIIQYPQDILAVQEILWRVKPDLVIETGIAHGGSLILSASMLELLGGKGQVIGIDIDIREANREKLASHPLSSRLTLIEGSSTDPAVASQVNRLATGSRRVVVVLDSDHSHAHVLRELQLYSPLVSRDSYLIVLDTFIEDLPEALVSNRPWGKGNNPRTALQEFLQSNPRFIVDQEFHDKLLISSAPDGYLRCVRD